MMMRSRLVQFSITCTTEGAEHSVAHLRLRILGPFGLDFASAVVSLQFVAAFAAPEPLITTAGTPAMFSFGDFLLKNITALVQLLLSVGLSTIITAARPGLIASSIYLQGKPKSSVYSMQERPLERSAPHTAAPHC